MVHHRRLPRFRSHLGGSCLNRGDKVAATARSLESIADLAIRYGDAVLPLALDVTDSDQVRSAIDRADGHFGRLDIVLNNAGYALVGAVEETAEADIKAEFETSFFGTLRVIQAALPLLRKQGSGHIIGVSSVAGLVASPIIGFYHASKWAFEAMQLPLQENPRALDLDSKRRVMHTSMFAHRNCCHRFCPPARQAIDIFGRSCGPPAAVAVCAQSGLKPITIESGPSNGSTRVATKPASRIQAWQSPPV